VKSARVIDGIFNIEAGERGLVGLLFAQYFCTGIASVFTQTASFALFLSVFDAGVLPYTYLVMAVALSALTLFNLKVGQRLGFNGLLRLNLGTQIVFTLVFASALTLGGTGWVIFLLPVLFQLAVVYGNMTFWSLAGRLLDVRQGRRLFGLVGAGEWMAIVIMGFLMPAIVPLVGLGNLLWLAVAGAVGALLLLNLTLRRFADRLRDVPQGKVNGPPAAQLSAVSLLRNPYVAALIALTVTWWVGFFFFDNIFYAQSARQFPDSTELAGFLGIYLGILGVLTLITSSLFTGRVIAALGPRVSLLILPLGLLAGALIMAGNIMLGGPFIVLFVAAVASRVWGVWIGFSIDQSARSILYQPLPPQTRTRVQMAADGIAQPFAIGLAGIAMLALGALFPGQTPPLVLGAVVLSAVLLGIALLASRGYARSLLEALDERRLRPAGAVSRNTSLEALKRGLDNPSSGAALHAMRALHEADPPALEAEFGRLLSHPSPHVRQRVLELIAASGRSEHVAQVRDMLRSESEPSLRGEALATLGALGEVADLQPGLSDAEPAVREGAIIGALTAGKVGNPPSDAIVALERLACSSSAEERGEAARIVARVGTGQPAARAVLERLIDDPDQPVRRRAIRAAGQTGDAGLLSRLVARMGDRSVRSAALAAVGSAKDAALAPVAAALAGAQGENANLLRALGGIGTKPAQQMLLPYVDSLAVASRDAAVRALWASGFQLEAAGRQRGFDWLKAEAAHGTWLCECIASVGGAPRADLLRTALGEQLRACRERLFILLGFLGSRDSVQRALEGLDSGEPRQVAYAQEALDLHVPHALKRAVLPLMLPSGPDEIAAKVGAPALQGYDVLKALAEDQAGRAGRWVSVCARHALGADRKMEGAEVELIEKVLVLRTAGIFDATKDEVLAEVAAIAEIVEAPAGRRIVEEGSNGDSMFVIASGRVRVHRGGHTLSELGAGELFGEMALLDPEPRSASVTVIEDAQLLRLDQQTLFELIEQHPEVARGMLQVLTRRLRQSINRELQPG